MAAPSNVTYVNYGPVPQPVTCPFCNAKGHSVVKAQASTKTHIIAALLFFFGACCCCCFIPYCVDSCKNKNHFCPQCHAYLGTYQNL
ncbi:zf-LITAF-like domain containing protein [Asbolus verrucosus]|uniref:Zf-LITAF-like domain containing protein n=1 Tax=Asbolus verrucosus TaxID=1661398 RepID=A0A482VBN7_ASBVE|nr:zf-LITAF-like domain containing protein [Asbolus verrucosus]